MLLALFKKKSNMPEQTAFSNNEVWTKFDRYREVLIVHVKPDLTPHLLDVDTKVLYTMPEGMLEYVNDNYKRKYQRFARPGEDG